MKKLWAAVCYLCVCVVLSVNAGTVWLSDLDISKMTSGWSKPLANRSVDGNHLSIGGRKFEKGVGTHADSRMCILLAGNTAKFSAHVGIDDEVRTTKSSVIFAVFGDGKELWNSGICQNGKPAKEVKIDIPGIDVLVMVVSSAGDGISYDHADWADAKFEFSGVPPVAIDVSSEEKIILTPPPPLSPRINGARIVGVRPGHPFTFQIPATGVRPMRFSAEGLPEGLNLNHETGLISGKAPSGKKNCNIMLKAKNALGEDERELRIAVGDKIALTPPMGWNSWNCFASDVSAEKVREAADAMRESGLINHGWTYINIDDYWEIKPGSKDPTLQGIPRDENGNINSNPRFPDMTGLVTYIHSLGLKAGIYSSPGPRTCGGCVGSYGHELRDARRFAEWGIDYLKYDWCSYGKIAKNQSLYELMKPYFVMRDALREIDRDIVYSLCQYGRGNVSAWGATVGGNCWRTTGDITDNWRSMSSIGFAQNGLHHFAGPGNWNDPDMLVVGKVGWGPQLRTTRLTANEQYTHISLWCLLASPLLIGCDMTELDDFTLGLLTNDEVLEVNQDPLGKQAHRVSLDGAREVWAKKMEDGSMTVGLFNRGELKHKVVVNWRDLGIEKTQKVRDLWRQKNLGVFKDSFSAPVDRHGVVLVKITPNDIT